MAEIEFAGIKFKGGRMVAVAMGLSTLVGGLYGGFEVYKDYMDMKEMIQSYVAPDLSGFQEQLSVIEQKMASTEDSVIQAMHLSNRERLVNKGVVILEDILDEGIK